MDKQEYVQKILSKCEIGVQLVSEYKNAKEKLTLKCKNNHTWQTTSNSIISRNLGGICKQCKGFIGTKKTTELVDKELADKNYIRLSPYINATTPLLAKNISCNHEYLIVPSKPLIKCKVCTPERTQESFIKECEQYSITPLEPFHNMKTNIKVLNKVCGHEYTINPGHFIYEKIGKVCKVCSSSNNIKSRFLQLLQEHNLYLVDTYTTSQNPVTIINGTCEHDYLVIPNNLVCANTGVTCRICNPLLSVSQEEIHLVNFIKEIYTRKIEVNTRSILNSGKELDIYLPEISLAFEYNGSYWHSEEKIGKLYHLNKTVECTNMGIQLIHISDYYWKNKQNIVKSRISYLLGHSKKIYARKTTIKQIDYPVSFLNDNHIQGAGSITPINYGLYYDDTLVSVMTFSKPRFSSNQDYELVRFANLLNTTVIGGASKLLSVFRKEHPNASILSYSDKQWSTGTLYKLLGFKFSHSSVPNYKYFKYDNVLSRYQCQKHLLKDKFPKYFSEDLTEEQIMSKAGYHRVYDCGNDVWVLE